MIRNLKLAEKISTATAVVGGVLLLVSSFLNHFGSGSKGEVVGRYSAWNQLLLNQLIVTDLLGLVTAAVVVLAALRVLPTRVPWSAGTIAAALVVLVNSIVSAAAFSQFTFFLAQEGHAPSPGIGIGFYLAIVGAILLVAGCVLPLIPAFAAIGTTSDANPVSVPTSPGPPVPSYGYQGVPPAPGPYGAPNAPYQGQSAEGYAGGSSPQYPGAPSVAQPAPPPIQPTPASPAAPAYANAEPSGPGSPQPWQPTAAPTTDPGQALAAPQGPDSVAPEAAAPSDHPAPTAASAGARAAAEPDVAAGGQDEAQPPAPEATPPPPETTTAPPETSTPAAPDWGVSQPIAQAAQMPPWGQSQPVTETLQAPAWGESQPTPPAPQQPSPPTPFSPFWAAVPTPRPVYQPENGSALGMLQPGTWYAVVGQHGSGGYLVQLPNGATAVLTETGSLIRG